MREFSFFHGEKKPLIDIKKSSKHPKKKETKLKVSKPEPIMHSKLENKVITQFLVNQLCKYGFRRYASRMRTEYESLFKTKDEIQLPKGMDTDDFSVVELQMMQKIDESFFQSFLPQKNPSLGITAHKIELDFTPDPWQRDLIALVNQNKSVLVSAPTSSGKTFLAFYAIEKTLREYEDGVVVFISPTKVSIFTLLKLLQALVNQVYAELLNRFKVSVGMFTGDDKLNVKNCRVLVALPATFEILMLSQTSIKWREKIKLVVFDEVHCINEQGAGAMWEHVHFEFYSLTFI